MGSFYIWSYVNYPGMVTVLPERLFLVSGDVISTIMYAKRDLAKRGTGPWEFTV